MYNSAYLYLFFISYRIVELNKFVVFATKNIEMCNVFVEAIS